ncbi:hypothetical protein C4S76_05895 [Apibacter adventoris]|nr:hypothetical protein C4S76_05895 [Apibacter adventoris]
MKDILKKALKEKFLIGVYLNAEDTSKFTVGYVEKLYEEAVLLSVISPDMITDGFALLNIDLIYLIEYNNTYLINIEKIITKEKEISIPRIDYKRNNKKRLIVDFINFCKKTNKCITVKHNYGFEILGYISNVDDYYLLLDTYTEEGLKNGYTVIRIEEINEIYFGGQSQIKIEILSK